MDDRKPPESNVVRLRRDGEPDEAERRRLSQTIFASEDEVGTFSRGNLLLPPRDHPPPEPAAEPVPFFEQLQAPDQSGTPAAPHEGGADTIAYFEKLGSQTAAEMSVDASAAQATSVSMPGSARLPAEVTKARRRTARRDRAATPDRPTAKATVSRHRSRFAMAPVAAALGVLVIAGAALAAFVTSNGHGRATQRPLATHQSNSGFAIAAILASSIGANKDRAGAAQRGAVRQHQSEAQQHHRRVDAQKHVKRAARGPTTRASSSSAASTVPVSATPPVQSTPPTQEPASAASSSATSGGSGSGGAGSSHQPVWGANGILGPGHSPNG